MDSRIIVSTALASATAVTTGQQAQAESGNQEKSRPNIVYIMSDDHSMQTISSYGYGLNETPNIDRIAENGVLLRNNFVTNAISGPCRAVVMTGKFSHKNGFKDNQPKTIFDGSQQTFPKLLHEAGYNTAMIGKWHLGSTPTGFDYYCIHVGQGTYYSPVMIEPDGKHTYEGEYSTHLTVRKSIDWIDSVDKDEPFCLMMHFKAPHRNWMPAPDKMSEFEDVEFRLPETFYDDYSGRKAAGMQKMSIDKDMRLDWDLKLSGITPPGKGMNINTELSRMTPGQREIFDSVYNPITEDFNSRNLQGKDLAEWKYQRYMRDYCKVISSVDDAVGEMLDYLEKEGLLENTIVIYTSDQGFYMGEHGWFDKRFMYEESFHTPFLISYPAEIRKGGKELDCFTQNIDIAPTLLDFAGVAIPSDIQGESMKPVLTGRKRKIRDAVYYHYYEYPLPHEVNKHYGVRNGRYKLIRFYGDADSWELFDLKKDPCELENVYDMPGYRSVREKMKEELHRLQIKYEDTDPEAD
ncbi:MAG: sulfatase [Candidatus Cryptobacteroides sp.]